MSKTDLKEYLPDVYDNIVEIEAEQDALSIEIDKLDATYEQAMMDQFVQYASEKALVYYENIFSIVSDPSTETLEFRRERILTRMKILTPPYTHWFLRAILDTVFGKNKYDLQINENEFTIVLESSSSDSLWYHEVQVSITQIKPCNMIFIQRPRVVNKLLANESIYKTDYVRNYKLNGTWKLGLRPFITEGLEDIYKMAKVHSVETTLLQDSITYWTTIIKQSVINDVLTTSIDDITMTVEESQLVITYRVTSEQVETINKIQLQDESGNALLTSNVYIPVDDLVDIKHIIKLEEGVND